MVSFFSIKNFKSGKIVMEFFLSFNSFKSREKVSKSFFSGHASLIFHIIHNVPEQYFFCLCHWISLIIITF